MGHQRQTYCCDCSTRNAAESSMIYNTWVQTNRERWLWFLSFDCYYNDNIYGRRQQVSLKAEKPGSDLGFYKGGCPINLKGAHLSASPQLIWPMLPEPNNFFGLRRNSWRQAVVRHLECHGRVQTCRPMGACIACLVISVGGVCGRCWSWASSACVPIDLGRRLVG